MSGRPLLTKHVFLEALECTRRGWLLEHPDGDREPPSIGERFRFTQGNIIGDLAREFLGPGLDLRGPSTTDWIETGRAALADARNQTLYEVPVVAGQAVARPDMLQRAGDGWRLVEVKSAKKMDKKYLDDVGYTIAVAQGAGLMVTRVELLLVNPDWRCDNDEPPLVLHDVSGDALARAAELAPLLEVVAAAACGDDAPAEALKAVCKNCQFLGTRCFAEGPPDPVFQLPRILAKRVDALIADGVTRISQLGDGEKLNPVQQLHRRSVLEGGLVTVASELATLDDIAAPIAYLDFETVSLALPPIPGVAPHDAVPIQFSVHRPLEGGGYAHDELLLDPAHPDLRQFADRLLAVLDGAASIIVYSPFERRCLRWLAERLPAVQGELEATIERLVDLLPIVQSSVAHPDFHGSLSIKKVLPVLVPAEVLTYHGLEIANGDDATGVAGLRALGRVDDASWDSYRNELLAYCAVDTLAMARLHEALLALR